MTQPLDLKMIDHWGDPITRANPFNFGCYLQRWARARYDARWHRFADWVLEHA